MSKEKPEVERVTMTTREGDTTIIKPSPDKLVPAKLESEDAKNTISPTS